MWFRGVAASVGLCFDFSAVLEGHPDVVLSVNGDVVHHRQPVCFPELRQRLPTPQVLQVGFDLVLASHALGNQVGDLGVSGLGLIEPRHQTVVPFLVLGLIEGNVGVLLDAILNELGCDVDFRFQLRKLTIKGCSIEALGEDLLLYAYKLFFLVDHLIGGPEEQFFYFILGERRCAA